MKMLCLIAVGGLLSAAAAGAAEARSYSGGRFALDINGSNAGLIQSVQGGDLAAEVVTYTDGGSLIERKLLAGYKYDDFTIKAGAGLAKSFYDWISDTVDGSPSRKNGAIVCADFNYKEIQRAAFQDALITEITIPACDAAGKDSAFLTVKFSPESVQWTPGLNKAAVQNNARKQKLWSPANFRLSIPGLESARVSKIEAFTIKQKIQEYTSGEGRTPIRVPGKIEYPNLRVTLPLAHAASWLAWSDDFIVKGKNGDGQKKNGTLTFLSQDLTEEVVRVSFQGLGACRVQRSFPESGDAANTVTFDLFVERMEIDFMAQFEK